MFDIGNWSKEKVHSVSMELLYSFNFMWFLMDAWGKENCPEKVGNDDYWKLFSDFGAYEAQRLEKTLDPGIAGLDRMVQFLRHSHWSAFENLELTKLSGSSLRMRTHGCTAQKAVKKWGREYHECGKTGLMLRTGFFGRIDPMAKVQRVFTPPDARPPEAPEEASCEWIITLPGKEG